MEVWADIINYPDYKVSTFGRILGPTGILSGTPDKDGYIKVHFRLPQSKHFLVHRLVATAFIPNTDNKLEVDHINRINTDNRIENLRWATRSENSLNRITPLGITNEKHITTYLTRVNREIRYRVSINRNEYYSKSFKTLEEAIQHRDNIL